MIPAPLPRSLHIRVPPMRGTDIDAVARAMHRYLKTGNLDEHEQSRDSVRETWGTGKELLARKARAKAGLPGALGYGAALDRAMILAGAFDAYACQLREQWIKQHTWPPAPAMVYPHPAGYVSSICQGIHETAGLDGNMALDLCCHGGTPVLAPVAGEVVKISGRNPAQGANQAIGIFGWSQHIVSQGGYRLFATHFGRYTVYVGQKVKAGSVIGYVGGWPGDPGRSHTHLGVTSPYGRQDAIRYIEKIGASPRVRVNDV